MARQEEKIHVRRPWDHEPQTVIHARVLASGPGRGWVLRSIPPSSSAIMRIQLVRKEKQKKYRKIMTARLSGRSQHTIDTIVSVNAGAYRMHWPPAAAFWPPSC